MSVEARLRLQISEFTRNYDVAVNHAKKKNAEVQKSSGGIGSFLLSGVRSMIPGGLARLGPAAAVATGFIVSLKEAMTRQAQVAGLTGVSLENVNAQLERLKEMSQLPGLGFDQAVRGSIKLQAVGMSAEAAEASIREMGNALALVGGGSQGLDGVILAITQILSKGKVSAEEINQIAERLPQVRSLMKEAFGTSDTDALQKMGISSEVFIDGLVTAASGLTRAAATTQPEIDNLKDSFKSLMAEVGAGSNSMMPPVLAALNKAVSGAESRLKEFKTAMGGIGSWVSDFMFGGTGYADEQLIKRDTDAAREKGAADDVLAEKKAAKEAADAATAAAKEQAEALVVETEAAEELAKAMEKLAALKEKIADQQIDALGDPEKLEALQQKLQETLAATVGNFSLNYDPSAEGLLKLAEDREKNKALPAEGTNSAAEAYEWLGKVNEIEKRKISTEEKIAADKKKAADEEASRQKELADLRTSAESGRVGMLSEEEQTAAMRDKLSQSLAVKITGGADIERGLKLIRGEVESARKSGDEYGEKEALERLNEAQRQASEFTTRIAGEGGPARQGEFQDFVDEIFNRDPAAEQLRVLRDGLQKQDDLIGRMDAVIKKMDAPPPRDIFSNFVD